MHGLVRCEHERRCSRTCRADVSFRDVSIKIPDRGCDQGCEWRHAPQAWAEIWEKSVSWDWDLGEARWICALQAPHMMLGGGATDGKISIERLCLSPCVEKPNSKVIKSFVPELRSRKCFLCFRIPVIYEHFMNVSHIHVWVCYSYNGPYCPQHTGWQMCQTYAFLIQCTDMSSNQLIQILHSSSWWVLEDNCIPCREKKDLSPKKEYSGYDTKLHLVTRL